MEMNFCRRCGAPLALQHNHVYSCSNGHVLYANSNPAVGIFVLASDTEVFLGVRGIEPNKGMLDSFGGFVDGQETLENAAMRELTEESGLEETDCEPLKFLCSGIGNYPFKGEVLPILSSFFWTRIKHGKAPVAADDIAEIIKVPIKDVDFSQLHDEDVRTGMKALQSLLDTIS